MANTTRQNILNNIKTTLKNVSQIRDVEIDRASVTDLESLSLPCAFIYPDKEIRDASKVTMGYEAWTWNVSIEIWTRDSNLESILQNVHADMHANGNYKRGGYASNSYRTDVEFFYIDPEQELRGMLITYTIDYDHPQGVM